MREFHALAHPAPSPSDSLTITPSLTRPLAGMPTLMKSDSVVPENKQEKSYISDSIKEQWFSVQLLMFRPERNWHSSPRRKLIQQLPESNWPHKNRESVCSSLIMSNPNPVRGKWNGTTDGLNVTLGGISVSRYGKETKKEITTYIKLN